MKELLLRLIYGGKVVGYEWKYYDKWAGTHITLYYDKKSCIGKSKSVYPSPKHDSFDVGTKVGDEWWFSDDKIKGIDVSAYPRRVRGVRMRK